MVCFLGGLFVVSPVAFVAFQVCGAVNAGGFGEGFALFGGAVVVLPKSASVSVSGQPEILAGVFVGVVGQVLGVRFSEVVAIFDQFDLVAPGHGVPGRHEVEPFPDVTGAAHAVGQFGENRGLKVPFDEGVEGVECGLFHGVSLVVELGGKT